MRPSSRFGLSVFLLALGIAVPALAFEYPLSSTSIRDAYFLGRADQEKRERFFALYRKLPPIPPSGPHVSLVQLETPFAVVVERSAQAISGYYAQDAEQEFLDKPGVFRLRLQIDLTASYGSTISSPPGTLRARPDDFWRDFKVHLIQKDEVASKSVHGSPMYSLADARGGSYLIGGQMELDYDAGKIMPRPATVEVIPPEGDKVEVTFNLDELR